jgi:hypothetical protein
MPVLERVFDHRLKGLSSKFYVRLQIGFDVATINQTISV